MDEPLWWKTFNATTERAYTDLIAAVESGEGIKSIENRVAWLVGTVIGEYTKLVASRLENKAIGGEDADSLEVPDSDH